MEKRKIIGLLIICLIVVGSLSVVLAYSNNTMLSFDELKNTIGEVIKTRPIKDGCLREEWNFMFEEFKDGNVPKDEMKEYVFSCIYQ